MTHNLIFNKRNSFGIGDVKIEFTKIERVYQYAKFMRTTNTRDLVKYLKKTKKGITIPRTVEDTGKQYSDISMRFKWLIELGFITQSGKQGRVKVYDFHVDVLDACDEFCREVIRKNRINYQQASDLLHIFVHIDRYQLIKYMCKFTGDDDSVRISTMCKVTDIDQPKATGYMKMFISAGLATNPERGVYRFFPELLLMVNKSVYAFTEKIIEIQSPAVAA